MTVNTNSSLIDIKLWITKASQDLFINQQKKSIISNYYKSLEHISKINCRIIHIIRSNFHKIAQNSLNHTDKKTPISLKKLASLYTSFEDKNFFALPSSIQSLEEARREASLIFCHCLNLTKVQMLMHKEFPVTAQQIRRLEESLNRRLKGEPLAYIFEKKEFFSLDFKVNKHTLIPRPETEQLVEIMLDFSTSTSRNNTANTLETPTNTPLTVLDLGCGTGCISLSFLKNFNCAHAVLCDISPDTLEVAKENAQLLDIQDKTQFLLADFTAPHFPQEMKNYLRQNHVSPLSFDIIVSNPPYIPQDEYEKLHPSVKDFEPKIALISPYLQSIQTPQTQKPSSKYNALFHIQAIFKIAENFLKPQGILLIEHGYNQAEAVRTLCKPPIFTDISSIMDYGGKERFLKAKKI